MVRLRPRYKLEVGGEILPWNEEPFATFYRPALLLVGLTLGVFLLRHVYTLPRSTSFVDEASLVVGGLVTAMAGVILAAYFFRFIPSRLVFLYAWTCAVALAAGAAGPGARKRAAGSGRTASGSSGSWSSGPGRSGSG